MNTDIAVAVIEELRFLKQEIKLLKETIKEDAAFIPKKNLDRMRVRLSMRIMESHGLNGILIGYLLEANIAEEINSFNPQIYTR